MGPTFGSRRIFDANGIWVVRKRWVTHHEVSKEWVVRFVEHRVGDRRIIRLIRKWLKAGVLTLEKARHRQRF